MSREGFWIDAVDAAGVTLENVSKQFADGRLGKVDALRDVSVAVRAGELMVFVGPSGCGKTTLLRLIAGLEMPTSGRIFIAARLVNQIEPKDRDVAMVFQDYALYPHMTVFENMAFGLRARRMPLAEVDIAVRKAAELVGVDRLLQRKPRELSGGQRQRVALGRAIVRSPKAFLLDEPLSNLDAQLRASLRLELAALHRRLATTMLFVTHDQTEAMTLGDRIAVMHDGRILQVATPRELYERPANVFVARFIGSPPMNLIPQPNGNLLGIRPEKLRIANSSDACNLRAVTGLAEHLGSEILLHAMVGETTITLRLPAASEPPATGMEIELEFEARDALHFDARTGERL